MDGVRLLVRVLEVRFDEGGPETSYFIRVNINIKHFIRKTTREISRCT